MTEAQAPAFVRGMRIASIAADAPDRVAIISPHGNRTFGELNANANSLARALRARGITQGDALGLVCANRPEFAETLAAAFLTGRSAEVIISGGVNIYPAEVDAVLLHHPAVADVATVGVPNADWGEEVKSVVQLKPGVVARADELIEFCRERLAHFKCPRTIDWDDGLPRHDTGKIYRRLVRDRYWQDRTTKI